MTATTITANTVETKSADIILSNLNMVRPPVVQQVGKSKNAMLLHRLHRGAATAAADRIKEKSGNEFEEESRLCPARRWCRVVSSARNAINAGLK
jgi:hypothetical protein